MSEHFWVDGSFSNQIKVLQSFNLLKSITNWFGAKKKLWNNRLHDAIPFSHVFQNAQQNRLPFMLRSIWFSCDSGSIQTTPVRVEVLPFFRKQCENSINEKRICKRKRYLLRQSTPLYPRKQKPATKVLPFPPLKHFLIPLL